MSQVKLELLPTAQLCELLETLGQNTDFQKLMKYLEARCTGLGVWGHSIQDETLRMWAGGRVQELSDLLAIYENRHRLVKLQNTPAQEPNYEL